MALTKLKSNLSNINEKFKPKTIFLSLESDAAKSQKLYETAGLDVFGLPRTNTLDQSGNTEMNYDEKNKYRVTLTDNSLIRREWDSKKRRYYDRGLKNNDQLGLRNNDKFGFDQPYVIKEVGDKWGPDAISSWDAGIIRGGASTVVGRVAGDAIRLGKFLLSPKGLVYTVKQAGLQVLNVGGDLGERANIYNPISPLLNTVPIVHTKRHIELEGEAGLTGDLLRIGVSNLASRLDLPFSAAKDAVLKKNFKGDDKRAVGFRKVAAIGDQGKPIQEAHWSTKQMLGYTANTRLASNPKVAGDKVNLIPYGSKDIAKDKTLTSDNLDFVPFRFKDVNNNKYIIFRALLSGITDNLTPEFAAERYVGRPDQVYVYQGTNREISFTFDVYPKTRQELPVLWEKLNYLVGLVYPSWAPTSGGLGMIAPFIELTIGDMYKDTPGFLSQLSLTVQDGTTWEIDDWKLPKYIQAACSFTYIGKYLPNQVGKHYELDWLSDTKGDGTGTFSANNTLEINSKTGPWRKNKGKVHKLFEQLEAGQV